MCNVFSSAFSPPSHPIFWISRFSIFRFQSLELITCQHPRISVTSYFQMSYKDILLSVSPTPFQLTTLPRISLSTHPDSSKTLALYKSCTYLLTALHNTAHNSYDNLNSSSRDNHHTTLMLSTEGKDGYSHKSTSTRSYTPPLSSLEEHVEADSGFPLFLDAVFTDFTLTADNKVSPECTANSQVHI